ncbi:MarR family transcriptional regulator [soil metagenome]
MSSDKTLKATPDAIDRVIAAWRETRPDLDPGPLGLVGRVIVLADHLRKSVDTALGEHGLSLGQFDILATLRRHDENGGMTPGTLLRNVMLSSGGMTNRLDRLERDGLVLREDDPSDRRGVIVKLTPRGRKLIDEATETRFAEAAESLPPLSATETKSLAKLLRRWLAAYDTASSLK